MKIFLDMDGVIVDFVRGVKDLTGKNLWEFSHNLRAQWEAIAGVGDFYAKLEWMPDGKKLYESLVPFEPILLTGIPHGKGWPAQKYKWIYQHLDPIPQCIIKHPGQTKMQAALEALHLESKPEETWVLIDDTAKMCGQWENEGGVALRHKNAEDTLEQLLKLFDTIED